MVEISLFDELKLEQEFKEGAMRDLQKAIERRKEEGAASETIIGKGLVSALYNNFSKNVDVWLTELTSPKRGVKPSYIRLLKWLVEVYDGKEKELRVLLCMHTLNHVINATVSHSKDERRTASLSNISRYIGAEIVAEAQVQAFMNAHGKEVNEELVNGIEERCRPYYRTYYAKRAMENSGWRLRQWTKEERVLLGGALIDLLLASTDLFQEKEYEKRDKKAHAVTMLYATPLLIEIWRRNEVRLLEAAFRACPTIIPPKDWTGLNNGGYHGELSDYFTLIRLRANFISADSLNKFDRVYQDKLNQVNLTNVLTAINAIQATPWKINKRVLDVVKQVLDRGGNMAEIPQLEPYKGLPYLENPTDEELRKHKKAAVVMYKKEARRHGQAIRTLATVKMADRFKDYEKIYFPHNMDFRGRVYPIPSFSPQGDGLNKGLLLFADPEPVTSDVAIRWFKIAGAEFAGIDKVSFDECIKWVHDNEINILDSAKDPMGMIDWWGNLDSPWEFLSFCFAYEEMKEYAASHNGSLIGWKCGVPVAFDGSCSGLQHYSAILRDPIGAAAVNLKPADKPQDIYQQVADLVNAVMQEDAINGTVDYYDDRKKKQRLGTKTLAQLWLAFGGGSIGRKIVKRSVMTLAYGSREYGFRDQVFEDTVEPHIEEGIFTWENGGQLSQYMAHLIWTNVDKVVVKAVEGMKWLQEVSKKVCKTGNVITWTTPMGLPIQQPYLTVQTEVFRLRLSKVQKRFYVTSSTGEVDSRKQAAGIAPNFIHSMDAAHLQYSVLTAHNRGITHFAMIHDSYGTSIEQAEQLFHIVRECFVDMYTQNDVLADFEEEARIYIHNEKLPERPTKGDFDITEIKKSLYAFH